MSLLRFGFSVAGKTLSETIEELDGYVNEMFLRVDGEPWVTIVDDYKLVPIGNDIGNPDHFIYRGEREIIFAGPSVFGELKPPWRDGFRPQTDDGYPDSFA